MIVHSFQFSVFSFLEEKRSAEWTVISEEVWTAKSPRAPREDRLRDILFWILKLVFLGDLAVENLEVPSGQ
jgi:hypothetical protein